MRHCTSRTWIALLSLAALSSAGGCAVEGEEIAGDEVIDLSPSGDKADDLQAIDFTLQPGQSQDLFYQCAGCETELELSRADLAQLDLAMELENQSDQDFLYRLDPALDDEFRLAPGERAALGGSGCTDCGTRVKLYTKFSDQAIGIRVINNDDLIPGWNLRLTLFVARR